jgi:hypothetical protein
LDQRLKTTLTFEEYPLADRVLAAKILASKGLLRTVTPADINLPNDVFNFDAAKKLRENKEAIQNLVSESSDETHISLKELADLDPFNRRTVKTKDIAAEFGISPEPEEQEPSPESQEQHDQFLLDTFENNWSYNQEQFDLAKQNLKPEIISPNNLDWDSRRQDTDATKSGQYTLNPEVPPGFESKKVFIPDRTELKALEGKLLAEVGAHLTAKYSKDYIIPGIEYWEYILKNPSQAPQELKNSQNCYFYFGSVLRSRSGDWCVPHSDWDGSSFSRSAHWLDYTWDSNYRVVLLEK